MASRNSTTGQNKAYLDSFVNYERQPPSLRCAYNLERMQALLEKLRNPQKGLQTIHIAGTNGKGSVAAIVFSILEKAGLRTGLYSSPHLISYRERIRTTGGLISEEEIAHLLSLIKPVIKRMERGSLGRPTFFEVHTALAFLYFKAREVDFAVMEVGLGGRLDATNLCESCISIITQIAVDHTAQLGADLTSIAGEKAGIIRKGVPVVVSEEAPEVSGCIEKICKEKGAGLIKAVRTEPMESSSGGTRFRVLTPRFSGDAFFIPLLGMHQLSNAACAISAACLLNIDKGHIASGLENVYWPGRAQFVEGKPSLLLDGGHNPAAASSFRKTVKSIFPDREIVLIIGISADKDMLGVAGELSGITGEVIFTRADNPRSAAPAVLKKRLGEFYEGITLTENVGDAIAAARAKVGKDGLICITGSLFLVGEALQILDVPAF